MTNEPGPVLPIWVVYDHPSDFPNVFIARCWIDEQPQADFVASPAIEDVRHVLASCGFVKLARMEGDDPVIMETWL
jgi:hypothetical protein